MEIVGNIHQLFEQIDELAHLVMDHINDYLDLGPNVVNQHPLININETNKFINIVYDTVSQYDAQYHYLLAYTQIQLYTLMNDYTQTLFWNHRQMYQPQTNIIENITTSKPSMDGYFTEVPHNVNISSNLAHIRDQMEKSIPIIHDQIFKMLPLPHIFLAYKIGNYFIGKSPFGEMFSPNKIFDFHENIILCHNFQLCSYSPTFNYGDQLTENSFVWHITMDSRYVKNWIPLCTYSAKKNMYEILLNKGVIFFTTGYECSAIKVGQGYRDILVINVLCFDDIDKLKTYAQTHTQYGGGSCNSCNPQNIYCINIPQTQTTKYKRIFKTSNVVNYDTVLYEISGHYPKDPIRAYCDLFTNWIPLYSTTLIKSFSQQEIVEMVSKNFDIPGQIILEDVIKLYGRKLKKFNWDQMEEVIQFSLAERPKKRKTKGSISLEVLKRRGDVITPVTSHNWI